MAFVGLGLASALSLLLLWAGVALGLDSSLLYYCPLTHAYPFMLGSALVGLSLAVAFDTFVEHVPDGCRLIVMTPHDGNAKQNKALFAGSGRYAL